MTDDLGAAVDFDGYRSWWSGRDVGIVVVVVVVVIFVVESEGAGVGRGLDGGWLPAGVRRGGRRGWAVRWGWWVLSRGVLWRLAGLGQGQGFEEDFGVWGHCWDGGGGGGGGDMRYLEMMMMMRIVRVSMERRASAQAC